MSIVPTLSVVVGGGPCLAVPVIYWWHDVLSTVFEGRGARAAPVINCWHAFLSTHFDEGRGEGVPCLAGDAMISTDFEWEVGPWSTPQWLLSLVPSLMGVGQDGVPIIKWRHDVLSTDFDPDEETANFGTRHALESEGNIYEVTDLNGLYHYFAQKPPWSPFYKQVHSSMHNSKMGFLVPFLGDPVTFNSER